jgi:hypothetical protein
VSVTAHSSDPSGRADSRVKANDALEEDVELRVRLGVLGDLEQRLEEVCTRGWVVSATNFPPLRPVADLENVLRTMSW